MTFLLLGVTQWIFSLNKVSLCARGRGMCVKSDSVDFFARKINVPFFGSVFPGILIPQKEKDGE